MTLVLELPIEVEAELREAAAARGVAVEDYAVEKLRGGSGFDEAQFKSLLTGDPLAALDYVVERTPDRRTAAGLGPLPDNAVAMAYEDSLNEKASS